MILCVYFLGVQMIGFALGGGMAGIAEAYEGGLTVWELVANAVPFVVLAGLGVGLGVRRDWRQALQRLGLVWPTGRAVLVSLAVVFGLFMYVALVTGLWMALVSEETYQEQTEASEALSESVSTMGLAFVLAATAAVGEEIAYRGALQPVFGLWPTAIVFALTHAQYALTPAWLIILGVAIVFGWLRQQYGTVAAILAHFVYNFVPLAITVGMSEEALLALARLVL
jgi:membrane protease YdiL (CAAX protease family)